MRDKTTQKVVAGANPYDIRNCTTLDDGRIVCGTLKAEIVIYNPTWKHLRTIVLTKEEKGKATLVTTDRDGMIVAVVSESAVIYIYNPDDGSVGEISLIPCWSRIWYRMLVIRGHGCEH